MKNDEIRKTELDEANLEQVCGGENPLILVQPLASEYDAVCPRCAYTIRVVFKSYQGYCPDCHVRLVVS